MDNTTKYIVMHALAGSVVRLLDDVDVPEDFDVVSITIKIEDDGSGNISWVKEGQDATAGEVQDAARS